MIDVAMVFIMEESPDSKPQIIETRWKARLLKGWKYPIGAEIVTKGLEDCTRRDELRLGFSCYKTQEPKSGEPRVVLTAEYGIYRGGVGGWDGPPKWEITVEAVPREIAFRVKELLIEKGLPEASAWLSRKRTPTWLDKTHRLDVEFDGEIDRLVMVERD